MHGQRPITTGMPDAPQAERILPLECSRYELKMMAKAGRILKLEYDAAAGELLRAKGTIGTVRDKGDAMRLLVVEDNPELGQQLRRRLESEGHAVDLAADGEEGQFLGETKPYDVIILDLGLPKIDGLTVLRSWRRKGVTTPVLILTARGAWNEKVEGIDAGADDYLAKPFSMEEMPARVRALMLIRRAKDHAAAEIACGAVVLDTRTNRVTVDGRPIDLTAHEYRVLAYLMHRKGQVVSRTELTEHIYAQDFDRDSNTIEVFIGRLRRKLGADIIKTVRGLGYRLEAP